MDPLLTRLRRVLSGQYAVEQELGRGGMAVVFLGHDLRLQRRVAIKVFEREEPPGQASQRFLREIQIAAQLQHPNILPIFSSGEAEGLVYYVMPYVAGATLRERLEREGPLPVPDVVRVARDVAEAVDHAHAAGIVHRDIKPDNIMLVSGAAVVADFGIARALEQEGERLTDTGLAIGTPNYMSPEQATASAQVDGRADIYALGCVVYELLAGEPPFSGPTAQAVMARHTTDPAPPLRTVRDVPSVLEAAVLKALAKAPADRWQTGRAFADALERALPERRRSHAAPAQPTLRRLALGGAGVALVLAAAWLVRTRLEPRGTHGGNGLRTVAVLPFLVTGDTGRAILADGIEEGVTTALVRVEGLGVIPSGEAAADRDRPRDPRAMGRALGVSDVVSGTIEIAGNRLRVTAELTNVADGVILWRDHFDGEFLVQGQLQDIFSIQDAITSKIVEALRPRLTPATQTALARGVRTRDPVAYNLYLQARRNTGGMVGGNDSAIVLLQEAIQRDSSFADAWAALADAYNFFTVSIAPVKLVPAIRHAVDRAIALDERNGLALASRGLLRLTSDWDFDGARRDLERAVELAPASAAVAMDYAVLLQYANEPDSAVSLMRRVTAIEPNNVSALQVLALRLFDAGRADSGLRVAQRELQIDSTSGPAYWLEAMANLDAGRRREADFAIDKWLRNTGRSPMAAALTSVYYRRTGDRAAAQSLLDDLLELRQRQYVPPSELAVVRLAIGDRTGALSDLEEGARNNDLYLMTNLVYFSGPLKGNPRFEAVSRRVFGDRPVPRSPYE